MREDALHRVRRLFPDRARIKQVADAVEVRDGDHLCWIPTVEIDALTDDLDVSFLVTGLLYGLVK